VDQNFLPSTSWHQIEYIRFNLLRESVKRRDKPITIEETELTKKAYKYYH